MKKLNSLQTAIAAACLMVGATAHAQTTAPSTAPGAAPAATMSRDTYKADKDRIEADYKAAKAQCDSMSGNAKDICVQEAKGKEKVAKAELEATRSGKAADANKARMVKAEADYEVAKERCDDKAGNEKDVCKKEAKAAEAKAKADLKASASKPS